MKGNIGYMLSGMEKINNSVVLKVLAGNFSKKKGEIVDSDMNTF